MFDNIHKIEKQLLKNLNITYKRYLFDEINFSSGMIAVVGSRGVGKTTLLLQYLKELKEMYEPHKSLYFSYEYPSNVDVKLYEFAEEFAKIGGEYLLLDEIHKYSSFSLDLKAIYDFYPNMKVIFTGSCATSIYNSQADLSRRVVLYTMHGLSYREFLEIKLNKTFSKYSLDEIVTDNISIVDDLTQDLLPLEHFGEYLEKGYYPFYFHDKASYLQQLNAVINLTIDIDFVSLGLIKSSFTHKLKKLLNVICHSKPFELNITKVASNVEVSRNTLYSYLHHLSRGALLNIVADNKKGITALSKPEKLYLNNTNLFYALCQDVEIGTLRETFFVNQLKAKHELSVIKQGDFIVDDKFTFEIGGKNKTFKQIKDIDNSFIVVDTDSTENINKIPLWLFGFLY
ncbi:MAG: AAA family ATPase [Campylobacterota bacterium]|nr:AAA family ATPase [Campylobacterota bacterium]